MKRIQKSAKQAKKHVAPHLTIPSASESSESSARTLENVPSNLAVEPDLILVPGTTHIKQEAAGLTFDAATTYDEWLILGKRLGTTSVLSSFMLGDWLLHGAKSYKNYKDAVVQTGLTYGYLRNMASVCKRFPPDQRIPGLTFEHHRLLAPITDQKVVNLIASQVKEGNLTTAATKHILPAKDPKKKTDAQLAAEAKALDDNLREKAGSICAHLVTLPASKIGPWVTILSSLIEISANVLATYNAETKVSAQPITKE